MISIPAKSISLAWATASTRWNMLTQKTCHILFVDYGWCRATNSSHVLHPHIVRYMSQIRPPHYRFALIPWSCPTPKFRVNNCMHVHWGGIHGKWLAHLLAQSGLPFATSSSSTPHEINSSWAHERRGTDTRKVPTGKETDDGKPIDHRLDESQYKTQKRHFWSSRQHVFH